MKWFFFCFVLIFSQHVIADSFTKSNYYIEIDSKTKESMQYYSIMGLDKPVKITTLNNNDLKVLAGKHLRSEEEVREYGMCNLGYTPLVFYTDIEYISIHPSSVVFFVAYYAKCFNDFDVTEQEKISGILSHKE